MSGSPPKTTPYPSVPHQMFSGLGASPQDLFPQISTIMHRTPPNFVHQPKTSDLDDNVPPPIGFNVGNLEDHPALLSYDRQELLNRGPAHCMIPEAEPEPEDEPEPEPESEPEPEPEPEEELVRSATVPVDTSTNLGNFRWVGASSSSCSMPGALLCGHDIDGSEIYAGRAYHMGDMIPAKVIPSKQVAYIAYGGEEIVKDQFELLCPPSVHWVRSGGGQIPSNAVSVGTTADGEPLFFGRVHHEGGITPGKIQASHGCCYYPYDGAEASATEYEVLVIA